MNASRALLDSCAAVKLVLDEPGSEALRDALETVTLVGSALLEVEVGRTVRRTAPQYEFLVEPVVATAMLVHGPGDFLFTYDERMAETARANGLDVQSPR